MAVAVLVTEDCYLLSVRKKISVGRFFV